MSKNNSIAILVERQSRFILLIKIKDTNTLISALINKAKKLSKILCKSLTWDRGSESASHKKNTIETNVKVYFSDLGSP